MRLDCVTISRWAAVLAIVCLTGCARPVVHFEPRIPFPEAEYQALPRSGKAVVKGQAFLKTVGGDVKTAAGNKVWLNPITSYSRDWYARSYMGGARLEDPDPRINSYVQTQTADGDGRFTFRNVPPGAYYVTTSVVWQVPMGYADWTKAQGGIVAAVVRVDGDETVEVIVTR